MATTTKQDPPAPPADAPVHVAATNLAKGLKGAAAKLAFIQATITTVDKTGKAPKFSYFQEHGILALVRPYMLHLKVAIYTSVYDFVKDGNVATGMFCITLVDTELPPGDLNREISADYPMEATDNQGWSAAKLLTYGNKFAMQKFLAIPTEDVPEAEEGVEAKPASKGASAGAAKIPASKLNALQRDVEAVAASDPSFVQKFSAHVIATYKVQKINQLTDAAHVDELRKWVAERAS